MKRLLAEWDPYQGAKLFEGLVTENEPIDTWEEFQSWSVPFQDGGCFRGHREASWGLVTTLDRALYKTVCAGNNKVTDKLSPSENEQAVLAEFQRGAHRYHAVTPALDQIVEWLALMQHYGAPTRLLDWTRSPYVALYFAMQGQSEGKAAVWAMDLKWFEQRSNGLLREHYKDCPEASDPKALGEYIDRILFQADNPFIIVPASPLEPNERMLAQKAHLLCSLRHDVGFSPCLLGMLIHPSKVERQVVSKVIVERDRRISLLEELRGMDIHRASLFPGLDGFGRSLAVNLDIAVVQQIESRRRAMFEEDRRFRLWLKAEGLVRQGSTEPS